MQRDEPVWTEDELQDGISEKVHEIVLHREVIDQAKGMLMLVHGIDADKAFELLRWRSQHTNTKLHALAQQVVTEFTSRSRGQMPDQATFDDAFMTAHERLPSDEE